MRSIAAYLVVLVAALGAGTADAAVTDGRSAAALSLLETAQQSLSTGQPQQAAILIERALRIDPGNPTLWHYLGVARRELGDSAQADVMAAKARSLTPADRSLRARNAAPAVGAPATFDDDAVARADESARTWSFRSWFGARREPSVSYRNTRPGLATRNSARDEHAAANQYCEVWTFDERGRRQSWIMQCDDAQRYAARGGAAVMIKTRSADRRDRGPGRAQQ